LEVFLYEILKQIPELERQIYYQDLKGISLHKNQSQQLGLNLQQKPLLCKIIKLKFKFGIQLDSKDLELSLMLITKELREL
jgi:hypothetical protein